MPSTVDNMSVDRKTVEDQFLDTIFNGDTDARQLAAAVGDLVRSGRNLDKFIVGNGHWSHYSECFNNCVGEDLDSLVLFLQVIGNSSGYGNIENYLNSIEGGSIASKLGFGVEKNNVDGVSNGVSNLGNRIRKAIAITHRRQQQHGENKKIILYLPYYFDFFSFCANFNYVLVHFRQSTWPSPLFALPAHPRGNIMLPTISSITLELPTLQVLFIMDMVSFKLHPR